jgi:hypothetical protein
MDGELPLVLCVLQSSAPSLKPPNIRQHCQLRRGRGRVGSHHERSAFRWSRWDAGGAVVLLRLYAFWRTCCRSILFADKKRPLCSPYTSLPCATSSRDPSSCIAPMSIAVDLVRAPLVWPARMCRFALVQWYGHLLCTMLTSKNTHTGGGISHSCPLTAGVCQGEGCIRRAVLVH